MKRGVQVLDDKAIVNAEDAVWSIRSGMSDQALMEKYELSQKGLKSLFRKLVAAGAIEQSVLDRRSGALHGPSWILSLRNPPRPVSVETEQVESTEPSSEDRSIWEAHKHYVTAVCGALVGGVTVFLAMTLLGQSGPIKSSRSVTMVSPADNVGSADLAPTEQLIGILDAIANERSEAGRFKTLGQASDYDECLNNCTKNFPMVEQSDKALLINCRRECIAQYAERVKAMRKRYYNDPNQD
ncbi:MAG: hypothetical protein M1378_09725 [Bacteroidetes bacterium]|nr:hypothetical protein [Bacteroidota bacterium]